MKIKSGFMLREIADSWVVVPIGQRVVDFNGLISLSESGALLWKKLETGAEKDDLYTEILNEYDIDSYTANTDVEEFIGNLYEKGLLEG